MGSGFIQRFRSPQSTDVYKSIEGVYIIDQGGPSFVKGQGTGTVAVIGEFADCGLGVAVDASGNVTTYPRPTMIFGADDLLAKLGSFDPLIGDIGNAGGNGYLDIDGCAYTGLIAVPVNLCSSKGIRVWRQLATNQSATNPSPVVPMAGGTVDAGREFKTGSHRVRTGTRVSFRQREAYLTGVDGSVSAVAGAATAATCTSAVGPFDFRSLGSPQLRVVFNAGGNQDFNVTATAATKAGSAGTYPATGTYTVQFAGGATQAVTVTAAADATAMAAQINSQIVDGRAVVNGTAVDHVSDRLGSSATAVVTSTASTIGATGIANGSASGTGTVANKGAVTATELAAILSTLTNGTAAAVGGALVLTSTTTGSSGTASVAAASTAHTIMGGEFATSVVKTGADAGSGATSSNVFTSSGITDWTTTAVAKGDALVVGVIGAAGAQGSNALTLRVVSFSGANLTVEKQDGTAFNWTTGTALAWRLHLWDVADSGGAHSFSEAGGYIVPARPLDATITAGTVISPTIAPSALTASSADALSGLGCAVHPSGDLTYTASVQAPNVTGSGLDALYTSAINALLGEDDPQVDVDIAFASRSTQVIEAAGKAMVLTSYGHGHGRVWIQAPPLSTVDPIVVAGDAYPGAGAQRDESVISTWPGEMVFQPKAVNIKIATADGNTTTDGKLDVSGKGNLASTLSLLLPERNPGEATDTTALGLSRILGYQRGMTTSLTMDVYKLFKARGVCALKWTKVNGALRAVYQSGVTTSLTPGQESIGRRRLANYIEDSIGQVLDPLTKLPISNDLREKALMLQFNFLNGLAAPSTPALSRIKGFEVTVGDDPLMEEQDILVTGHKVRMFGDANAIVVTSEIGTNVVVTSA